MNGPVSRSAWIASVSALALADVIGSRARWASAQGLTPVIAAAGVIEAHAEAYYAADQGFFRKRGLDVQILQMQNGAAVAAAVAGGSAHFGCSTTMQLAQAYSKNLPFKIVAFGSVADARHPIDALMVTNDSGITSVKELNGKVIAVTSLRGLDQLAASNLIDKHGGDSKSIQFIEVSPRESLAALLQGRVAAAPVGQPQLQEAVATKRVRSLGDCLASIAPYWVSTDWFSTTEYLEKNSDTARRFAAAIYDAGAWAMANRLAATDVLNNAVHSVGKTTYLYFATGARGTARATLLQPVLDVAAQYGYVSPIKSADLLWSGA